MVPSDALGHPEFHFGELSVGHEEDGVAVVLAAGVLFGQMSLGLFDQIVLVLAGDRLAAWAIQMRLHIFTIAYVARW